MRTILTIILVLTCSICYPATMDVKTGYGYILDGQNNIVSKYEFSIGKHPIKDGYIYKEVNSRKDLDAISVYQAPVKELTIEEKLNKLGITKEELKTLLK